ncbi:MAG TPA: HD domain-containing phosphohydrolase [Rhodocyclaceae bacterium]|nr:HD domain-containing phosphohydrolase [Rhodocyclaceae bacterium]
MADGDIHFERLSKLTELIAGGDYDQVNSLLEMTSGSDTPPKIAALAEAIGHMVVQIEAREWRLELLIKNLLAANLTTLELLGAAVAKRDSDTGAHNFRVAIYAVRLAEAAGLDGAAIRGLIKGAFLHDVGKIGITDQILLKPGKLDADEFTIMKTHVQHGVDIVAKAPWLEDAVDVVRCHHEKFDGSGYPAGLVGEAIPINARIFAIADVFDALTSRRPYKEPMSVEKSLGIIAESSGSHFDPKLVAVFKPLASVLYADISSKEEDELSGVMRGMVDVYFEDAS